MRERANKIGTHVQIWSHSGTSTEVALEIPARLAYTSQQNRQLHFLDSKTLEEKQIREDS
jgi:hypothetical protein